VILASTGSAANPNNPYAATKAAAEALCKAWGATFGLDIVVLRFTNLYGPWSAHKGNVIPTWVRTILAGKAVAVNGDGTQEIDFLHTADMARAVIQALQVQAAAGQTITVGSGTTTSLLEVLGILRDLALGEGLHDVVEFVPDRQVPRPAVRPEEALDARDLLGWAPTVELRDGIAQLWDWFAARQDLVEEPESAGVGSCELLDMKPGEDAGQLDITFRDSRGKRRRKVVARASLVTWLKKLERGLQRAALPDQHDHRVAIEEAVWLISHFPDESTQFTNGAAAAPPPRSSS
jgi:hypothetical protein